MSKYNNQSVIVLMTLIIIIRFVSESDATGTKIALDLPLDSLNFNQISQDDRNLAANIPSQHKHSSDIDETSHRSIYSSLMKILHHLKDQLDSRETKIKSRQDTETHVSSVGHANKTGIRIELDKADFAQLDSPKHSPTRDNAQQLSTVTLNVTSVHDTAGEQQNKDGGESMELTIAKSKIVKEEEKNEPQNFLSETVEEAFKMANDSVRKEQKQKSAPSESKRLRAATIKAYQTDSWPNKFSQRLATTTASPGDRSQPRAPRQQVRATTARSLTFETPGDNIEDESSDYQNLDSFGPPLFSVSSSTKQDNGFSDDFRPVHDHTSSESIIDSGRKERRPMEKKVKFAYSGDTGSPLKTMEYFGTDSLNQFNGVDGDDHTRGVTSSSSTSSMAQPVDQQSQPRLPKLSPSSIHLQRINTAPVETVYAKQRATPFAIYPNSNNNNNNNNNNKIHQTNRISPPNQATAQLLSSPSTLSSSPSGSSYYQFGTTGGTGAASNQFQNRDLLNQPQTIQITAIPNGATGNSLIRINGMPMAGAGPFGQLQSSGLFNYGNGAFGDPFGRQVYMIGQQAERRQIDWSVWIWPMLAAVALPMILAALFVPIFLKTIVFLIQILQSLGLLLPLASAISQQLAQASGIQISTAIGQDQNQAMQQHQQQQQHQHQQLVQKLSNNAT